MALYSRNKNKKNKKKKRKRKHTHQKNNNINIKIDKHTAKTTNILFFFYLTGLQTRTQTMCRALLKQNEQTKIEKNISLKR